MSFRSRSHRLVKSILFIMYTNSSLPHTEYYLSLQLYSPKLIYPDQKLYCLGMFHSSNKHWKGQMNEDMFGFHLICDKAYPTLWYTKEKYFPLKSYLQSLLDLIDELCTLHMDLSTVVKTVGVITSSRMTIYNWCEFMTTGLIKTG